MQRFSNKVDNLREKGLTLTELMIVVVVLAALAVLAFWAWRTQLFKGYDSRRKTDIYQIKVAVEEYERDHDCYPPPYLVVCKPDATGLRPYLDRIPCDPQTGDSYYYEVDNEGCAKWYRLMGYLENSADDDIFGPIGPGGIYNYYSGSPNAPEPGATSTTDFYGCKSGACVQISWDTGRPGPECDPNYEYSTCYGQCYLPENECLPWK
jgi:prepilin-type N-terminal cleavage/methylation domain-containing protein